jgi:hypothetical protein
MPARLASLRNNAIDPVRLEPARLGNGRGRRKGQGAGRFGAREQAWMRQAEMEAHDSRARLLHDSARSPRKAPAPAPFECRKGRLRPRHSKAQAARQRASIAGSGAGSAWQKKLGSLRLSSDGGDLFAQESHWCLESEEFSKAEKSSIFCSEHRTRIRLARPDGNYARSPVPCHIFGDRSPTTLDAKLEEFSVDPGSTPQRVG